MTDFQTLNEMVLAKQQYFSHWNLAIGMGTQLSGLLGKNMWYSLIKNLGKSATN